jgi:hypothetical protein
MQVMTIAAAALFLLSVLVVVAALIKSERQPTSIYELLPGLLSQGERAFYRALLAAVSEHYVIAPKVRVADVLKVAGSPQRKGRAAAFNKIAMKHFDFVLCDPRTLSFVGAIELDDQSHNRRDRVDRDKFLNDAAAAAKLPLHRFQAKATYVVAEIRDALLGRPAESEFASRTADRRIEPTL